MKNLLYTKKIEKLGIFLLTFFFSVLSFAQNSAPTADVNVTTTKTTTTEQWFTNPVYWVIGAVLLIILVAVIVRGGKRED